MTAPLSQLRATPGAPRRPRQSRQGVGWSALAAMAALVMGPFPAGAAERSRVTYADLDLASPRGAHLMLGRIDQAAVAVCGGGRASLREVNQAVRRTVCWREALDGAVASLDAPQVTQAWRRALGHSASVRGPRPAASVPSR